MIISEITATVRPAGVSVHEADDMRACAYSTQSGIVWVSLGENKHGWFDGKIDIFLRGDGAFDKAQRLAKAFNAIMVDPSQEPVVLEAAE